MVGRSSCEMSISRNGQVHKPYPIVSAANKTEQQQQKKDVSISRCKLHNECVHRAKPVQKLYVHTLYICAQDQVQVPFDYVFEAAIKKNHAHTHTQITAQCWTINGIKLCE